MLSLPPDTASSEVVTRLISVLRDSESRRYRARRGVTTAASVMSFITEHRGPSGPLWAALWRGIM